MKKSMLLAMCLSASFLGSSRGGVNSASAKTASMSVAAVQNVEDDGNKDDVTAGDETNKATFSWSGSTLTVTGKGDLSKITVTDNNTKVFSATGAGKVYTKTTTTTKGDDDQDVETVVSTAVKEGDAYISTEKYYEPTITYGAAITPKANDYDNQKTYTWATNTVSLLASNQTLYSCYYGTDANNARTVIVQNATTVENAKYSNWGPQQKENNYYYYCVVEGTLTKSGDLTLSIGDKGEYSGDGYKIILLNADNINQYAPTKTTIKANVENLYYSSDATNYNYLAKDATVEYTNGMLLYTGTVTVKDDAIDNNATYFAEHSNYLEAAVLSFAEYLPHAVGTTYSTVIIKTDEDVEVGDDNSKKANINNAITRALAKCTSIVTLNLEDTYLPEIKYVDPTNAESDPTFYMGSQPGTWEQNVPSNTTLTTLYMPDVAENTTLYGSYKNGTTDSKYSSRRSLFYCFPNLKNLYLGEGITTLDTYAFYESSNPYKLKTLVFPNTLETIKTEAVNGQDSILVFTFPKNLKVIEKEAFNGTNPRDVYFLGVDAPKVARFAWGDRNYIANNSLTLSTISYDNAQGDVGGVKVDLSEGVACRSTYMTQNGWMSMLHYPAACSKAQAAKYTDITRTYKKIHFDNPSKDPEIAQRTDAGGTTKTYYCPGKETEGLKGTGESDITGNLTAYKEFFNEYEWPNPDPTNPKFAYEYFGGDYQGGYDDIFVGTQYTWPSMVMAQRATIVAQNGLLWDGVTKIGEGIKNNLDNGEKYEGDGTEFEGLHQFVFAQGDVKSDDTREWDVTKYADGKWHSLCLPFDITKAKLEETFGPDANGDYNYRVCLFSQVDRTADKLKLYFNDEQYLKAENDDDVVIKAHISYMVKLKKEGLVEGEKVMLKDYVLVSGGAEPTNVKVNDQIEGNDNTKAASQYYFIGQYLADVKIPQYSYFFSKTTNGFRFQGGTNGKWNAYSSVVEAPNGAEDNERYFSDNDNQAKLATIWDEDETTGIDKVTIEADGEIVYTNDNVYSLNGQLVSTRGLNGLSKGIYIQNGKKFIVK